MILSCQHLKKEHGANLVLADVTLEVGEGQRVGLIGRNGTGKSTLLQLIAGDLQPDGGSISIQRGARIGYLRQIPVDRGEATVYQVLAEGYRDLLTDRAKLADLEARMATPLDQRELDGLLGQYAALQERFQNEGGYEMDAKIQQVAAGLQIPKVQFDRPFASLSGGAQAEAQLAELWAEREALQAKLDHLLDQWVGIE